MGHFILIIQCYAPLQENYVGPSLPKVVFDAQDRVEPSGGCKITFFFFCSFFRILRRLSTTGLGLCGGEAGSPSGRVVCQSEACAHRTDH